MNNSLKFRVCYTAQDGSKRMVYDDNRFLIGLDGQLYENYGKDWKNPTWEVPFDVAEPPIVQRCTGCSDKNKTVIFEGDIINYGGSIGTVEFFAGQFQLDWGDQTDDDLSTLTIDKMEVVGNTFEGISKLVDVVDAEDEENEESEEDVDLAKCEQCGEPAWDGYICHACGLKNI